MHSGCLPVGNDCWAYVLGVELVSAEAQNERLLRSVSSHERGRPSQTGKGWLSF